MDVLASPDRAARAAGDGATPHRHAAPPPAPAAAGVDGVDGASVKPERDALEEDDRDRAERAEYEKFMVEEEARARAEEVRASAPGISRNPKGGYVRAPP
jgi:hypothetical protein